MATESRAAQVLAVTYSCLFVSSIAVALRVYCRVWVTKAFAVDDWLAAIAQVRLRTPSCLARLF